VCRQVHPAISTTQATHTTAIERTERPAGAGGRCGARRAGVRIAVEAVHRAYPAAPAAQHRNR